MALQFRRASRSVLPELSKSAGLCIDGLYAGQKELESFQDGVLLNTN
jgi:hypothetical protein